MVVGSHSAFEISEVLQTGSERACCNFSALPLGTFGIELIRLNFRFYGYQPAVFSVKRYGWGDNVDVSTHLELEVGSANYAQFQIHDERDEVTVHVCYISNFPLAPDGSARLVLKREADEQCLNAGLVGTLGGTMRITGAFARAVPPDQQAQEADNDGRIAEVHIVGSGFASHWAVVFCFDGGRTFVCELTAINQQGERFNANNWIFQEVAGLDEILRERQCGRLAHEQIQIRTSPGELLWRCKTNPRNGEPYHLLEDNCQRWVRTLLVEGFNVDQASLPTDAAVVAHASYQGLLLAAGTCGVAGAIATQGIVVTLVAASPLISLVLAIPVMMALERD
eukprot:TRINITY_DN44517_c0_g1_i1.p1 TRINITY_DN44517_c0_g1~~TRINITY_DN44517_c0_g1_i1.p1  ORF type:complete len:338 (+),score=32.39 TRINITY_DN44517_c0_g1_i1:87-1100(+)